MSQMIRVSEEASNALRKIKEDTGITIGNLIEKYAIPALKDKFYGLPTGKKIELPAQNIKVEKKT